MGKENRENNMQEGNKQSSATQGRHYVRLFFMMEGVLLAFLAVFYISCGEALYVRKSDGSVEEFGATSDTGDLVAGREAVQVYTSQMDMLDAVGVMVTNYGQPRTDALHIRVEDAADGRLLAEETFPAKTLGEGKYVYVRPKQAVRLPRGRQVRVVCTSDGTPGNAPMVCYNMQDMLEQEDVARDAAFFIDGQAVQGTMCIAVQGRDLIWSGPHYWELVLAAVCLAACLYLAAAWRDAAGGHSCLFQAGADLKKYRFLMRQLVARDFKVRYKRSILGVLWSFLNPLLTMAVQYFVFSQLFRSDIDNYPVYLMSGLVVFNFFGEGAGQALGSIVGNASLITKVYIPKYIYPATRVLSSGINLLMSLVPLVTVAVLTGERITKAYLMLPYILLCVAGFTIGIGMILAAGMTFFRDVQFLWGIANMLWMYLTPLFYPVSIVPEGFRQVILHNPMYGFVQAVRTIVMEGTAPQPAAFFQCTLAAAGMLAAGAFVFKKTQDEFIFYI